MNRYVWLSHILSEKTFLYGNGTRLKITRDRLIKKGDSSNSSNIKLSSHLGTHIDLPRHFFNNGRTSEHMEPGYFIFNKVSIIHVTGKIAGRIINFEEIKRYIAKGSDIVLVKTGFAKFKGKAVYWQDNPGLDPGIASGLRRDFPTVRAVGIDSISISSWRDRELGRSAHRVFLNDKNRDKPFLIIEDMHLDSIKKGARLKKVIVLPLRVKSVEASPCTVIGEISD